MSGDAGCRPRARGGAKKLRPHLDGHTGLSYRVAGLEETVGIDAELYKNLVLIDLEMSSKSSF